MLVSRSEFEIRAGIKNIRRHEFVNSFFQKPLLLHGASGGYPPPTAYRQVNCFGSYKACHAFLRVEKRDLGVGNEERERRVSNWRPLVDGRQRVSKRAGRK